MGAGDYMPMGRHKRKHDPKRAKKIKEGGKRADAIRKMTDEHHQAHEVPKAEEELMKDLSEL